MLTNTAKAGGVYKIECHDAQGNLKWEETTHNLVVNEGLQDMNNKFYQVGGGNPTVCVLDFGGDKTSAATFTVQFPAVTSTAAIIRIS